MSGSPTASRVKDRRLALGLTQADLAARSGVSQATVARIERSDNAPSAESLRGIAKALAVTTGYLLGESDELPEAGDLEQVAPADSGEHVVPPTLNKLGNWPQLRAAALRIDRDLPSWALDEVGRSGPLSTVPITPAIIAKLARIVMEHTTTPDR